ncbi:lipoprotein [Streptomyces albus]|uniref:Lipoprotein n=1 Tax=Streptomyces albus (strain ATCC 21838 / DSM 41398 / FERM P-419 / JCM 4703 / NBRC 107858) TaxID=1081613 RepID=A0A0B5EWL1_STRA4|nr:lipoprotein [Streptomyces albus]
MPAPGRGPADSFVDGLEPASAPAGKAAQHTAAKTDPRGTATVARRTRTLHLAAALTTAAALLLTACGGDGDGDSPDTIEGADKGSRSPSPSASASPRADRPEITLPAGFRAEFTGWTDSDPKAQAVLDDGKERLRGSYAAIGDADPDASYLSFYSARGARESGRKWVAGYEGLTLVGEVRVYDPQARLTGAGAATLFYCVDESRGFSKDLKTGKKEGTPKGESPKVQYRTALRKNAQGVWVTTSVESEPGGCR